MVVPEILQVPIFIVVLILFLPRTSLLRFWIAHQLVELLMVEFLIVALAVLNVDFDVFVIKDAISRKHSSEHVAFLVFLAIIFAVEILAH